MEHKPSLRKWFTLDVHFDAANDSALKTYRMPNSVEKASIHYLEGSKALVVDTLVKYYILFLIL